METRTETRRVDGFEVTTTVSVLGYVESVAYLEGAPLGVSSVWAGLMVRQAVSATVADAVGLARETLARLANHVMPAVQS